MPKHKPHKGLQVFFYDYNKNMKYKRIRKEQNRKQQKKLRDENHPVTKNTFSTFIISQNTIYQ